MTPLFGVELYSDLERAGRRLDGVAALPVSEPAPAEAVAARRHGPSAPARTSHLAAHDLELVAKDRDLHVLGGLARGRGRQAEKATHEHIERTDRIHGREMLRRPAQVANRSFGLSGAKTGMGERVS